MNGKKKIVCKYNWDVFWKSICLIGGLFNLDWNLLYRVKRFKALESIFTTPHRLLKYFLIQFNLICILTFWFPRKKVSIKKFCFVECEGDRQTEKCQILSSFQTNITILTSNKREKFPSSIWCWDSNSKPLEHKSPPLTTRPGLPP